MSSTKTKLLVVLGSGPGIGVGVASHFAAAGFNHVALLSRNKERLEQDKKTVLEHAKSARVETYAVDVADEEKLKEALAGVERDLGKPEVVIYNASRLRQTIFGETEVGGFVEDFKVAISGLYVTAMWAMPHLTALASSNDKSSHPSFLITGGGLYKNPRVTHFLLAIMKSGQVSLTGSLAKEYGPKGVHVANVAVGGFVGPDKGIFSPAKIAEVYWRLYEQQESEWELVAHIGC